MNHNKRKNIDNKTSLLFSHVGLDNYTLSCSNCGVSDRTKNTSYTSGDPKSFFVTDHERGEAYCTNCGVVLEHVLESLSEKEPANSYEEYQENTRTGSATSLARSDMGLYTVIDYKNKDARGNKISSRPGDTVNRLRKIDGFSINVNTKQRNMTRAFALLESLKTKLSLSQAVTEQTAYLYRKALEQDMIRGRTISALLGACLYAVCKDISSPRTLQEIHKTMGITRRSIAKTYRALHWRLGLKVTLTDAKDCVYRITTQLGLREKTARSAISLIEEANKMGLCAGKDPVATAGTAVYVATVLSRENATMKEISQQCGTAPPTIRVRSKEIAQGLGIDI